MKHGPEQTPATAGAALRTFFAQISAQLLLTLTLACAGLRLYRGDFGWADVVIAAALFAFWPLLEWLIHVHMLHYRPRRLFGREIDFRLPQTHREHHADPWWLERVFIPRHVFPLVLPPLLILPVLLFPTLEMALTFLAVYFLFALNYEWTHYLAHVRWTPPTAYYRNRVKAHRLHHFRNEQRWWGVSRGEADWLLRTAPAAAAVSRSQATHSLHREETLPDGHAPE